MYHAIYSKPSSTVSQTNAYNEWLEYDANGNMTSQMDKKISVIAYNFLNLPRQVTQAGVDTHYAYRADGLKVEKRYRAKRVDYLDGFQYENGVLQFVPTSEGYMTL